MLYNQNLRWMTRIALFLIVCIIALFWVKDPYPRKANPQMMLAPTITPASKKPFETKVQGITYAITPLNNYQVHGIVVAKNEPRKRVAADVTKDFNIVDLCVIWGENLKKNAYKSMYFRAGSLSCTFDPKTIKTDSATIHVMSDSHFLSKKAASIQVGDQITLTGQLAKYAIAKQTPDTTPHNANKSGDFLFLDSVHIFSRGISFVNLLQIILAIAAVVLLGLQPWLSRKLHFYENHVDVNSERSKKFKRQTKNNQFFQGGDDAFKNYDDKDRY